MVKKRKNRKNTYNKKYKKYAQKYGIFIACAILFLIAYVTLKAPVQDEDVAGQSIALLDKSSIVDPNNIKASKTTLPSASQETVEGCYQGNLVISDGVRNRYEPCPQGHTCRFMNNRHDCFPVSKDPNTIYYDKSAHESPTTKTGSLNSDMALPSKVQKVNSITSVEELPLPINQKVSENSKPVGCYCEDSDGPDSNGELFVEQTKIVKGWAALVCYHANKEGIVTHRTFSNILYDKCLVSPTTGKTSAFSVQEALCDNPNDLPSYYQTRCDNDWSCGNGHCSPNDKQNPT